MDGKHLDYTQKPNSVPVWTKPPDPPPPQQLDDDRPSMADQVGTLVGTMIAAVLLFAGVVASLAVLVLACKFLLWALA